MLGAFFISGTRIPAIERAVTSAGLTQRSEKGI